MMAAARILAGTLDRLPPVRGRLRADVALAPLTWFRVGGPAEILFRPADRDDLAAFLAGCPADIPVMTLGVASNLLVRDGGVPGVVIRLGGAFAGVETDGDRVTAGAGALDMTVAEHAAQAGLAGLEFLAGIPGTIGGAVRMNAGAYGREMVDILESVTLVTRSGGIVTADRDAIGLRYRGSALPEGGVIVAATLRGAQDDRSNVAARMRDIEARRQASQPVRARTGGSTFANPDGVKAWELIDRAGCRGLRIGGAQVSEQHCNFLINTGSASAADIEALGEEIRRRVHAISGIMLRWEILRIGDAA
jgi:UDP-N-acetylmuramate dehydrogenase